MLLTLFVIDLFTVSGFDLVTAVFSDHCKRKTFDYDYAIPCPVCDQGGGLLIVASDDHDSGRLVRSYLFTCALRNLSRSFM